MRSLRDVPIKQKLMVIIVLTTAGALLGSGVAIVVMDSILFRASMQRDLSALAQIVADNSTAALSFEDPQVAAETLAALKARPHLIAACIYRATGEVFATYARSGAIADCPAGGSAARGVQFTGNVLLVSRAIMLHERRIGTLVFNYDLGEIFQRVKLYGGIVLAILLAASLIAFLLSSSLRASIATPISRLAQAATSISATRDYSIRAHKFSSDEMGVLVDAFNGMLERIQSRDEELKKVLLDREEAFEEVQSARDTLTRANASLARSNEDLERFAFVASHDLQEPLRMITTYTQLLVKTYPGELDRDTAVFVENIVEGTKRMRGLLIDLLAYTEITAQPQEPMGVVDLNFALETAKANLRESIDASGAVITAGRLPTVSGYAGHFIPLFQNLIGNAIKYRSEHQPRIHVSVQELDGERRFTVADNGMGIDPAYHERIFEVFRRLHGKKIPGTGIGLAICQRIVERYGGRIWVESQEGKGSTFVFTIPLKSRKESA